YPHAWGVSPTELMVYERLEREWDSGRPQDGVGVRQFPVVQYPDMGLYIYISDGRYMDYWMAVYHSHWPAEVYPIFGDPNHLAQLFESAPTGTHLIVRNPTPVEAPDRVR